MWGLQEKRKISTVTVSPDHLLNCREDDKNKAVSKKFGEFLDSKGSKLSCHCWAFLNCELMKLNVRTRKKFGIQEQFYSKGGDNEVVSLSHLLT